MAVGDPHLASKRELEEEVQDAIGDAGAQGMLQIDLVALEHLVEVLGAPAGHHPDQVVLDHGYRRVGDGALLRAQAGVDVLAELLAELAQDHRAVAGLLAVQLDERQLAALRAELHLMVHVLEKKTFG